VRPSSSADNDLKEIRIWTAENFGEAQAETYARTISSALKALKSGPRTLGTKARDDIEPGLFTLHIARNRRRGRHFLLFRVVERDGREVIEVLRILHDSMDLARHLPHLDESARPPNNGEKT